LQDDQAVRAELTNSLFYGDSDICLNTGVDFRDVPWNWVNPVNTFETDGFCAMIPIPPNPSYISFLLDPYDWWSWGCLTLSIACYSLVWTMFRCVPSGANLDPPTHILAQLMRISLAQSITFRAFRWHHHMMIMIFVFAMFLFSNVYQSMLTALLTVEHQGVRLSTVNEMLDGDFRFVTTQNFRAALNASLDNDKISPRLEAGDISNPLSIDYQAAARNRTVFIFNCATMEAVFTVKRDRFAYGHPSDFYYILPEALLMQYEFFVTSSISPFHERLNELSLRIFESGIRQHWKKIMPFADMIQRKDPDVGGKDGLLKMNEFVYIFMIYGVGLFAATIAFLCEILLFNCTGRVRR
jgi:hypothetical protein